MKNRKTQWKLKHFGKIIPPLRNGNKRKKFYYYYHTFYFPIFEIFFENQNYNQKISDFLNNSRHNVAWWKSRCIALEAENETLREMIQKLVKTVQCQCGNAREINNLFLSSLNENHLAKIQEQYCEENKNIQKQFEEKNQMEYQNNVGLTNEYNLDNEIQSDDENFEFHVNEGMMDFLKQSIKHKMELKQSREEREALERDEEDAFPKLRTISLKERIENAKLLYGESSPRILGMETALQATIDSHKDRTRPNYWPNIPLKL